MADFRLYFLDRGGHIAARLEFTAVDDAAALVIAANIAEHSTDTHRGYMLWQGTRVIYSTDQGGRDGQVDMQFLCHASITAALQQQIVRLEEDLLRSHWCIARSQRLLEATSRLREATQRAVQNGDQVDRRRAS